MHPPFSLLRKERMRRARWKRENGGAPADFRRQECPCPRRGASGGLEVEVRPARLSPLPLTWCLMKKEGLPIFVGRPSSFVFRPPVGTYFFYSFGPCTARFLFFFWKKNRGPRKIEDFVGRGGRNGAERSPRRQAGTEWAEFLPTTWGVQCTSHRWSPIHPARQGEYRPSPTTRGIPHRNPPAFLQLLRPGRGKDRPAHSR